MEKNGAKYGRQLQTKSPRFPSSFPPHPQEGAPFLKEGGWRASILDSKRRLGTFKFFFGLILLILFSFLMALFFDRKVVRVLMVGGLWSLESTVQV